MERPDSSPEAGEMDLMLQVECAESGQNGRLLILPLTAFQIVRVQGGVPVASGGSGRGVVLLRVVDSSLGDGAEARAERELKVLQAKLWKSEAEKAKVERQLKALQDELARPQESEGVSVVGVDQAAMSDLVISGDVVKGMVDRSRATVTVPATIRAIGAEAFKSCVNLEEIVFEEGAILEEICTGAFAMCRKLKELKLPPSLLLIKGEGGLKSLGAFQECTGLTSIEFPPRLTLIGPSAFFGCYRLTEVVFPDTLTTIGNSSFCFCSGLTSLEFPDSLQTVGVCAFHCCERLTSVAFPAGLKLIGAKAFEDCDSLKDAFLPRAAVVRAQAFPPHCHIEHF